MGAVPVLEAERLLKDHWHRLTPDQAEALTRQATGSEAAAEQAWTRRAGEAVRESGSE